MAHYLNTATGEFPRHDGDLKILGWTPNEPLPADWVLVEWVEPPAVTENETVDRLPPVLVDGVWKFAWSDPRPITEGQVGA